MQMRNGRPLGDSLLDGLNGWPFRDFNFSQTRLVAQALGRLAAATTQSLPIMKYSVRTHEPG
jgi:hypothetical protein